MLPQHEPLLGVHLSQSAIRSFIYRRTNDLRRRIWEHKEEIFEGFTKKYRVKDLVYFEEHDNAQAASLREKRLKEWKRSMKIDLIEKQNPLWEDLSPLLAKIFSECAVQ